MGTKETVSVIYPVVSSRSNVVKFALFMLGLALWVTTMFWWIFSIPERVNSWFGG